MLKAALNGRDGGLEISGGTKFQIKCISKSDRQLKVVPISVGPEPNLYYALFDEDDVDFQVSIDNTGSKYRDVAFDMTVPLAVHNDKKEGGFVQRKNTIGKIKTLTSYGKKFHFVRQSSEDGQALISVAATKYGLTFEEAAKIIGQMKFKVQYSKIPGVLQIFVKTVKGNTITINAESHWKVKTLKRLIMDRDGTPMDEQVLVFHGKPLYDDDLLLDCGIQNGTTVHVIMKLRGGVSLNQQFCKFKSPNSCEDRECPTHAANRSERGVICFGENCTQKFQHAFFDPDKSKEIEFIIEMRMASRYSLDID